MKVVIEMSEDQIERIVKIYNKNKKHSEETTFSISKAARIIGISNSTIYRRIQEGCIIVNKMGKSPRITQEQIDAYKNLKQLKGLGSQK